MRAWCRAAVISSLALATQSSCAFWASVSSRTTACVGEPIFGVVDLVIGSAGGAALLVEGTGRETPATLVLPGVFLLSGVIGTISAYECRHRTGDVATAAPPDYTPSPPVEPPATQEPPPVQLALPPRDPPPKSPLQLDPDYVPPAPGPGSGSGAPGPMKCSMQPVTACPADYSCVLTDGGSGYCRPDR